MKVWLAMKYVGTHELGNPSIDIPLQAFGTEEAAWAWVKKNLPIGNTVQHLEKAGLVLRFYVRSVELCTSTNGGN